MRNPQLFIIVKWKFTIIVQSFIPFSNTCLCDGLFLCRALYINSLLPSVLKWLVLKTIKLDTGA